MAQAHNALRYYAQLAQGIKRAMGLQGDDEGTSRVSETLSPGFDVYRQPEHAWHRGEARYAGYSDLGAGGAGNFNKWAVYNLPGSGRLVVVERVLFSPVGVAGDIRINQHTAVLANAVNTYRPLDTRITGGSPPNGRFSWEASVALPGNPIVGARVLAGDFIDVVLDYVIQPGFSIVVIMNVANAAGCCTMWWRERQALPGELSG